MRRLAAVFVCTFASLVVAGTSGATAGAVSFSVLHSFSGPEGETPAAALVQGADGFFYGVAAHGGDFTVLSPDGGGTVFRMDGTGNVTTLHLFRGPEGVVPNSLIQGRDGFFYGTTTYGGSGPLDPLFRGFGAIFRMDSAGNVTVLKAFPGGAGGAYPGPIMQGADGALYGTASFDLITWSEFSGLVYRLDPATGDFRVLHSFVPTEGQGPTGRLFQGADGFFYGTTNQGGTWNMGVVYKVDTLGHFVLLHSFSPFFPGDGSEPKGGVIQASDGFFYGTTEQGGYGGEIFRMDAAGNLTVVHRFDSYFSDGGRPASGLIEGRDGFLYGTTPKGGQPVDGIRYGVVYRMDKAGTVTVLHTFTGPDGSTPLAGLAQGADGQLYGSTVIGGAFGLGVLFRVDPTSPAPPASPPTLTGLTLVPSAVEGDRGSTGTVTLGWPAPSGGAVVALSSSSSSVASVPATVTAAGGATSASFVISTTAVKRTKTATITASYNGSSLSSTLTVTR
jgi:uncharacterized repeat protein (TIGR03803 family)